MLKFIRTIDKSLEDFLILDLKTLKQMWPEWMSDRHNGWQQGVQAFMECHYIGGS